MGIFLRLLAVVAVLYVLACIGLFVMHRSMIYFPQRGPLSTTAGLENMELNGVAVKVSARRLASADAVLYFGGNGEDVSGNLPSLAAAFPDKAIYLLHYRGYGGSAGRPTEAALVADAIALFDKLHPSHRNITVIGRSLGSGVAVHLASVRPVTRLVLVTPYHSIAQLGQAQFPLFPASLIMADKFDSLRYAPNVSAPTTLIIAQDDEIIPRASSEQLYSHFQPGVARKIVIAGRGHNDISSDDAFLSALLAGR